MNILQLISSSGFFGAENVVMNLCRELSARGHTVFAGVVTRTPDTGWPERGENFPVIVFRSRGRFDPRAFSAIRRFIRDNRIDIVHSHNYKSDFLGYFARWGLRTPAVATCHNWLLRTPALRSYSRIDRYLLRSFDAVIPVSGTLSDALLRSGIRQDRITVIPNGISCPSSSGDERVSVRKEFRIGKKETVVFSAGRFSPEKGQQILLQAFSSMVRSRPHSRLLLAGEGPQRANLEAQARQLGIAPKVVFAGFRRDIFRLLAASDVFVLPSLTEAMPMALLEAMAAGIPCVATRVGSVPEIIGAGECGILVDPGDPHPLALSLLAVFADPGRAASMAARAKDRALSGFSAALMAQRYCDVYAKLEGGR